MRVSFLSFAAFVAGFMPAVAQQVHQMAENSVPVALVEVIRRQQNTEIHLETQAALKNVCWTLQGPNSPYLVSESRRYRFISGEQITYCPQKRGYASHEIMVLRFEPLPTTVHEFSLVEGVGG
jgi:hypothetical protein